MKRIIVLLVFLALFGFTVFAQDDIAYGDVIEGDISGRNGDEYIFEGEAGDVISIRMFSEDFDTLLRLYNEDGDEIAYNDDAFFFSNALIGFVLPDDGEYTIAADSASGSGDHTLSLELLDDSHLLNYGSEVDGRVTDDFGEVWVFEGTEGDVITVNMDSDIIDTYLELFSATSGFIALNDDSGGTWDSELANIQLPEDGVYFIVARSWAGGSNGVYTITIEGTSGEIGEVIGDPEGSLQFGDTVSGDIDDAAGDTWTFEGAEDDWILIAMSSPATDCYLDLYDPDGELLVRDDDSGIGYNAAILFELPDDGEYTIVTRAFAGRTGSYEMSLSLVEDLDELIYISVSSSNNVNLRDDAGENSNVVDSTYPGDIILLVGRSEDNQWLQVVSLEDEPLWVAARVTEVYDGFGTSDDLDDLPVTD